jgi:hypothetical protein
MHPFSHSSFAPTSRPSLPPSLPPSEHSLMATVPSTLCLWMSPASIVVCSSRSRAVTSECICRCRETSSGNG